MGLTRKIKAGLVKVPVNDFIGEDGNVFFDIDDGVMRLSDGTTPGGIPLSSSSAEGGASTFRQLLDTPSSFAGSAGTFLKINAQASAIEFATVDLFDGQYSSLTGAPSLFNPSSISQNLIPDTDITYDLGSTSARWRDLYLSGNTIFLGDVQISKNEEGGVNLPSNSKINGRRVAFDIKDLDDTEGRLAAGGTSNYNELTNLPTLFSGAYADLTGKPNIPTDVSDLTDTGSLLGAGGGGGGTTNYNLLTNLPDLTVYQLAASAFSGDYNDLNNKPALFSGSYTDLSDKPTLFSGAYADLTGKPTTLSGYGITDAATSAQGALADSALQSFTVTEGMITAHQAALSITESQISDLQSYLTAVSEAQVTAHQAALSITESQISDFGTYLTSVPAQTFASLTGKPTTLSGYGITDAATAAQGALADTALQSFTVTQAMVTAHQAALTITESQISDLGSYLTTVAYADLTSTPTTIAGYGLTDAYTKTQTDSLVSTAVANLIGDAPAVLDTLSELADAIGDDADFITTINTNIALKANISDLAAVSTSGSYNDLTNKPDVSELDDANGLLAASSITEDDLFTYSLIF